jgi:prepilin-type N-terminal cleavage/methylation domain-containing protein
MLNKISSKKRAFTLIELLVVIAIIGILASIVLVALNTARAKARDARRASDMHQISVAMQMYYDAQTPATYPDIDDTATAIPAASAIGTYMDPVPLDPGGETYYWTDLGTPSTAFCAWVLLEAVSPDTYVLSNANGTKQTTTVPDDTNCATL